MSQLYLKCKTCGNEFNSGKGLGDVYKTKNSHTCPNGHTNSYKSENFYFKIGQNPVYMFKKK
jgi:hypothetical protein